MPLSRYELRVRENQTLRFTKDGTFHISVFSDLHYGEGEGIVRGAQQDANSSRVMSRVLSHENPQLVVLNGDLISGEATDRSNSSMYIDRIVAPLVDADVPWASTYGNHDSDVNLSPQDLFAREKRYPLSCTESMVSGPDAGVSNYYLPVFPHDADTTVPAVILWFFDSKGGRVPLDETRDEEPVRRPNWVDDSVIEWFRETKANLTAEYGKSIPSLAFFHIPVYAMRVFQTSDLDSRYEPGINDERVNQQGYGDFEYDGQDMPFMQALLDTDGLMATFSGHDHDNDWCFKWERQLPGMNLTGNGIHHCYGRHTGYGGYGDWDRGGRQIMLHHNTLGKDLGTWIRLENGSILASVHLNSTYGQDDYTMEENSVIRMSGMASSVHPPMLCMWALFMMFIL